MTRILIAIALAATPLAARGDFIKDEVYVHLRAGPGLQYKILKTLKSGDEARKLAETDEWIQVQLTGGEAASGWIPTGYLMAQAPASIALPKLQVEIEQARAKIEELNAQIAKQAEAIADIEALRKRSSELENENARLSAAATWKNMATGVGIMLLGALIGLVIPRGGVSRTRLKL
jgi:SH3 domain protein